MYSRTKDVGLKRTRNSLTPDDNGKSVSEISVRKLALDKVLLLLAALFVAYLVTSSSVGGIRELSPFPDVDVGEEDAEPDYPKYDEGSEENPLETVSAAVDIMVAIGELKKKDTKNEVGGGTLYEVDADAAMRDMKDGSSEDMFVDQKEWEEAPFAGLPETKARFKKKQRDWWPIKLHEKYYEKNPAKFYVPRVNPNMKLSPKQFWEEFRSQGRAVIIPFESMRHLGFRSKAFTLSSIRELFPFDPKVDKPVYYTSNKYSVKGDKDDLNLGSALYTIEKDEPMKKISKRTYKEHSRGSLREFPRNTKIKPSLLKTLNIQKIPLMPEDTNFQAPTLWMGTSSADTKFHHDCCDNFVVMLAGTKRFTLAPPSDWRRLAPRCVGKYQGLCWASVPHPHREDTLSSKQRKVMESVHKIVVDVKAGEVLYMPAGWFHHIQNLGPTVMVNWWTKGKSQIALLSSLKRGSPPEKK